jgi:hypothetical protein
MNNIAKFPLKLIKNILILFWILGLNDFGLSKTSQSFIENPTGAKVSLRFAITKEEHSKGLSGLNLKNQKECCLSIRTTRLENFGCQIHIST